MTRFERRTHPAVSLGIALLLVAVLVADWMTPLGIAVWIFYVAPISLCLLATRPDAPLGVAVASTFGLVLGYFLSPSPALSLPVVQINRGLGFVLVWGVAIMVRQILRSRLAIQKQTWLRAGQNGLAEHVQGDLRTEQLGSRVLDFLARYLGAQVGAMYALGDGGRLRWVAGFATEAPTQMQTFELGESLIGQAASTRRTLRSAICPTII
jgi:hypothetical protein